MTAKQRSQCESIIKKSCVAGAGIAAGLGLTMIPGVAVVPLMGVEIAMIISLGEVFGIHITESGAKALLGSGAAAVTGTGIYTTVMSILNATPVVGPVIGGATAPVVISTLGWKIANHFAKNVN